MSQHHYTDQVGYNGIRASVPWHFVASQPPGNRPFGAYFTTLPRGTKNLAQKLRIPKSKTQYVFEFTDLDDLIALPGGRGQYIYYSSGDYDVDKPRHLYHGAA